MPNANGTPLAPTILPNIGTAGTYTKVTTDAKGRIISGTTLSASDIPTLTLSKISDAGTIASQNANAVAITGGSIDSATVGATTPSTGAFTSLSSAATITDTQSIGSTSTDGIVLINGTAGTVGFQKWSPRLRLTGQGWATTPVASQAVDWIIENQPVQGAANPSSNLVFSSQINAGGYASGLVLASNFSLYSGAGSGSIAFGYGPSNARGISSRAGGSVDLNVGSSVVATYCINLGIRSFSLGSGGLLGWGSSADPSNIGTMDTGLARDAAAVIRVSNGSTGLGALGVVDTTTGAVTTALTITHALTTANAGANGIGVGLVFQAADSTSAIGASVQIARLRSYMPVAAHASRTSLSVWSASDSTGERDAITIGANGSAVTIGLFGVTAVAQPATTGTTTGFTAGSGTTAHDDSTFTGGTGSTAYRISDIVLALKQVGILAA